MTFDPSLHHRRSIRLKGYDYHHPGAYFITLCTQDHLHLFGHIEEWEVQLNAAGKMVHEAWLETPEFYPSCGLDEFVVMPNHFHGVIWLAPEALGMSTKGNSPMPESPEMKRTIQSRLSLPEFVKRFKSLTTNRYGDGVASAGWPAYARRLWQRDYFEHIVRNEQELAQIRIYIRENPARWDNDPER